MTSTWSSQILEKFQQHLLIHCCLLLCVFILAWAPPAKANTMSDIPAVAADTAEAWLVTFGPGEIYWERFGHNAIWLREPAKGLDHTFNFGYFDFEQKDFFLRFMRGRMLYFSVAQSASREFEFYRGDNRSIRAQKLNLQPAQYMQLRDYLLNDIRPENRDYRYDYYLNNCSTRVRDALDLALGGALSARTQSLPAGLNFRDQTRRLTQMQFWYYLGLELGLGAPVDRDVSRWDEMFIPMVVADELAAMSRDTGDQLLAMDTMVFSSTSSPPAITPDSYWYRYLLLGLLVTAIAWVSARLMPPVWLAGLAGSWVLISATIGLALAALWLFTDHEVTRPNANLLLFNPLVLLVLVPPLRRLIAGLLTIAVTIAWLLLLLPGHQYNLDVLVLATPINLALAAYFIKRKT